MLSIVLKMIGSRTKKLAVLFSAAVLSSGCIYHPLEKPVRPARPLPAALTVPHEASAAAPTLIDEKLIASRGGYVKKEVTLRTSSEHSVKFTYYVPKTRKPTPAIICLPIMGGTTYPVEEPFASAFARNGYAALILHRPDIKQEIKNLEDIDPLLQQAIADTSRVIDWLERQPNIDAARLGLFGVSLGAIRGTLVLAFEERIKAGVLGLVGGDLPYILTHCQDKQLVKARDKILERNNLTIEEGEEALRNAITFEPLAVAPAIDPSRVMMVIAACDHIVPARTGWKLRRELGDPETIQLLSGHYTSVIHLPYLQRASRKFFEKRFSEVPSLEIADR